eukprot:TRINITY_DN1197_c0_g1_i2.p2 TRINITY_DN1197_c0_g1~~TRINITY_DN1197_c0_g1_i2.p2  ORF type:complete len:140 (-),score=4.13 TRINITY_DN1197_c0_g1_i2:120-518(-)
MNTARVSRLLRTECIDISGGINPKMWKIQIYQRLSLTFCTNNFFSGIKHNRITQKERYAVKSARKQSAVVGQLFTYQNILLFNNNKQLRMFAFVGGGARVGQVCRKLLQHVRCVGGDVIMVLEMFRLGSFCA